ncbi:hypothetical protein BCD67_16155 [Oscillatoriales cyanobacterium USR001]|nr:hypothetical protein BCD67_16155 [Oscillatoriales cyanobacterium USR001]
MYNTLRWFIIGTALFVSESAIVSYPAQAFERDSQSDRLIALSLNSFGIGSESVQIDVRPSDAPSYNFSIDYSDRRKETDIESTQSSNLADSTWKYPAETNSTTNTVAIPEPSTLLGLFGVSTLFAFKKRKSVTKA